MNKKKLLIIMSIAIVIIAAIVITIIVIKKPKGEELNNNVINHSVKVIGNLEQYISNLTNNYYIKYSGKFRNNSGELVDAIVEYTKSGDNFAFKSTELDMHLVCEGQTLSTVSDRYKIIVEMPKTSLDTSEYNLASDIGQTYVDSYKEKIGSTEYAVEEYSYNGKVLKYYFKDNDIKFIRYNGEDIRIIRLEKNTNNDLLVLPKGYTNSHLIDNI